MPLFRRNKPSWEPDWRTFPGRVEGHDAMLHADRAAVDRAPVPDLDVRLMVRVELGRTRPDGSPGGETAHQLYVLEDKLAAEVARRAAGHYIGRVVSNGVCVFVCQVADEAAEVKLGGSPFPLEISRIPDPEWRYVREVFVADPVAEQRSYNRPLVRALVSRGDRSEVPRPIEHSAHFAEQASASSAGRELGRLGYRVSASADREGGATVTATRTAPLSDIDEDSVSVLRVVREHGGDYDGWGCDLVR